MMEFLIWWIETNWRTVAAWVILFGAFVLVYDIVTNVSHTFALFAKANRRNQRTNRNEQVTWIEKEEKETK